MKLKLSIQEDQQWAWNLSFTLGASLLLLTYHYGLITRTIAGTYTSQFVGLVIILSLALAVASLRVKLFLPLKILLNLDISCSIGIVVVGCLKTCRYIPADKPIPFMNILDLFGFSLLGGLIYIAPIAIATTALYAVSINLSRRYQRARE